MRYTDATPGLRSVGRVLESEVVWRLVRTVHRALLDPGAVRAKAAPARDDDLDAWRGHPVPGRRRVSSVWKDKCPGDIRGTWDMDRAYPRQPIEAHEVRLREVPADINE